MNRLALSIATVAVLSVGSIGAFAQDETPADLQAQVDALATQVADLSTRVAVLEGGAPDAPASAPAATSDAPTSDAAPVGSGTRDSPLPIGTFAEIGGGWVASVTAAVPDATETVLAENSFNKPPEPGYQFFLVTISARYEGDGSSTLPLGNTFSLVGDAGVSYSSYDPGCGTIPNGPSPTEVFTGGTIEQNVCFAVPSGDAGSIVIYSEDFVTFDRDVRAWFAMQ